MLPDTDKKRAKPLIIKMAGYLEKKGRMRVVGVRRWKKRWCVLEGKLLLYFKTQLEYSHHLSPCRGSVNMGLVLSITPRGPCQLQIVTRSQIIIFRTKSKCEQDEWFAALRDAKHNNNNNNNNVNPLQSFAVKTRNNNCSKPSCDRISSSAADENHSRRRVRGPTPVAAKEFDKIFLEVDKKNGLRIVTYRKLSKMRKSESDNRISFYGETSYGVRVRTDTVTVPNGCGDKESCRSRSLSYESIYFKPQENGCAAAATATEPFAAVKSQSCRELAPCKVVVGRRASSKKFADCADNNNNVSKRMSRSMLFFQKRCDDSDSDDYDYVEITTTTGAAAGVKQKYTKPMAAHVEESEALQCPPGLPSPGLDKNDENIESTSTRSEDFHSRESNIDVIYVNNDRRSNIFASESESDNILVHDLGTKETDEEEDEPPPLPIKRKYKQNIVLDSERQYKIADGVYVFQNGAEEVIYDVPIPHGKLIEHFRRLTVAAPVVSPQPPSPIKCYANNVVCEDSLETSLYETLHMTPDSLEMSTMFPAYKRWSNDSGFNYEEPNSFSPDQTHFEDSLEPAISMIHRDRKIWQNVPNINSTDYFR